MTKVFLPDRVAYVRTLHRGLGRLRPAYIAHVCGPCAGQGHHKYRVSCTSGPGFAELTAPCDHCGGRGLRTGHFPATKATLNQVLAAADGHSTEATI